MLERQLTKRAAQHDHQAFAELYELHINRIYKYIYFRCKSTEEAEDLTSQVFMKAWEAIDRYQWEGYPFSTWLYRIAHNQMADYYRTRHRTVPLDTARADVSDLDPIQVLDRSLTSARVRAALRHLTRDQQRVIILRFLEGYDVGEIAALMGKDPAAVRALQHRGLRGLQPWIAEYAPVRSRHTRALTTDS